ncbi:MAG: helix-turn-helix transcriptional regulator [Bdellovibrionales bacterium]|nr:helix-turn-helix transcriptional regulator [Bdellovibrionales bacterium]
MSTKKMKYGLRELGKEFGHLTFGKLIEAYRLAEDLSQKDFAVFLGISQASLCDLEKGRRIPSPERASSIAKKLKEPESYWVQLAIQDHLDNAGIKLKVSVA